MHEVCMLSANTPGSLAAVLLLQAL
jgi:hypothetical protein